MFSYMKNFYLYMLSSSVLVNWDILILNDFQLDIYKALLTSCCKGIFQSVTQYYSLGVERYELRFHLQRFPLKLLAWLCLYSPFRAPTAAATTWITFGADIPIGKNGYMSSAIAIAIEVLIRARSGMTWASCAWFEVLLVITLREIDVS